MPSYQIAHNSVYHFEGEVGELTLTCSLEPRSSERQQISHHTILCQPLPSCKTKSIDAYGNQKVQLSFSKKMQRISVTSVTSVDVGNGDAAEIPDTIDARASWQALHSDSLRQDIYTRARTYINNIPSLVLSPSTLDRGQLEQLMLFIYSHFRYDVNATTVDTSLRELFQNQKGVCQDFARFTIALLQSHKIPALYVSGYLNTGQSGVQFTEQTASHAWVAVKLPKEGWVEFDPTNNQWVNDSYVTLAYGSDYVDIIPVKGQSSLPCQQRLNVNVTIERKS